MQSKQKINTVSLDILKVVIGEFEFKTRWGEFVWARFRVQAIGQKRVGNNRSYHYTDIEGVTPKKMLN
jgi:hypothetical protein